MDLLVVNAVIQKVVKNRDVIIIHAIIQKVQQLVRYFIRRNSVYKNIFIVFEMSTSSKSISSIQMREYNLVFVKELHGILCKKSEKQWQAAKNILCQN